MFAGIGALGYAALEGVGMIGDALGPGYRDLLQGVVGMGLVVAGPKLARMGQAAGERTVPEGVSLSQENFDNIKNLPRGSRPSDPRSYLGDDYVNEHLATFDKGGSYLTPTSVLDRRGRDLLGRPDGVFVMPKQEMDALITRSGGNIGSIENELGVPNGAWDKPGATLSRIDIDDPRALNLRIPNGNEQGANELWMPGGKLPGGGSEAVVDAIPKGQYNETVLGGGR